MSFLEVRFPVCPSFGMISAPAYNVTVARTISGRERRNSFWQYPLFNFPMTVGPRMEDEVEQVAEFFHGVGGMEFGFRLWDPADFKSCRLSETPAATDQPLIEIPGSPRRWQLTKAYTAGPRTQYRRIQKPVAGDVSVAANGVTLVLNTDYTLDTTTGIVDFLNGDDEGSPAPVLTWGGLFDVPVRFDTPELPTVLAEAQIQSVDFTLREIRV